MTRSRIALPALWLPCLSLLCFAVLVPGCGGDPVIITPRALDHAGRVAFLCLDSTRYRSGDPLVAYDNCVAPSGGAVSSNFVLHALVTQEARGEIASIDLVANQILDSQRVVPGFTFEPVGELPGAMVVPKNDPTFTFVSNVGHLDIFARATRRFFPESRRGGDLGSIPETFTCDAGSPVSDLVLSPDETTLYATLAERGVILEIPLTPWDPDVRQSPFFDETCSVRREIPLTDIIPPAAAAEPRADHCLSCPSSGCDELIDPFPTDVDGVPQPFDARDPAISIGTVPRPLRMTVDVESDLLLVADERLPLVHVFDLATAGGATALSPLNVGVPVQHLVLTPAVPLDPAPLAIGDPQVATVRYMYGIDGIDGSVFAADYDVDETTRQPSVALLPVNVRPDEPRDRLQIRPGARVLEVITTPEYLVDEVTKELIGPACSSREVRASSLRGVFLSVASNDGGVYIVDVYDLDATCRLETSCEAEVPGIVRRHRVRIVAAAPNGIKATGAPGFLIGGGSAVLVAENGTTLADPSPLVIPFGETGCVGNQSRLAPTGTDGSALVCGLRDPWAVVPESWLATWEGQIPGTADGRGRFSLEGGEVVFDAEVPFCSRGVLGEDNLVGLVGEPESGYPGDILVITGEVPARPDSDPVAACCTALFAGEDALVQLIDPTIQHAADNRLVIRSPRIDFPLPASCVDESLNDIFVALTTCFDELVTYEVRTRDSYAVEGTATGFLHRVVADVDGNCMVDVSADPARQGRAVNGTLYNNGTVSFTLDGAVSVNYPARGDQLAFSFVVGDTPTQMVLSGGTLLNDLRYNAADANLYSVDIGGLRGLARFTLDPFERTQTFE